MSFDDLENSYPVLTRKEFDRILQKNITIQQLTDIVKTERYLMMLFKKLRFRELTPKEKQEILDLLRRQSNEIWELLYSGCVGDTAAKHPEYTLTKVEEYAFCYAESLMLQELYIPPHFTKYGRCLECGDVCLPERIEAEVVPCCPWCVVSMPSEDLKGEKYEQ